MKTPPRLSGILSLSTLGLALTFAACSSDNAGKDGGAVCNQNGKAYKPGETVTISSCSSCLCLSDGKLGNCTGACVQDAMTATDARTKVDGAIADAPTNKDAAGSSDGAPSADAAGGADVESRADTAGSTDVAPKADASGNTDATPRADTSGNTDVAPKADTSGNTDVAPNSDSASRGDAPVTCSYGGKTYAIGETAKLNACTSCVCQADGTLGLCTGACTSDGGNADVGAAGLCTLTGGQLKVQACCAGVSDFPNTCEIGACSCSANPNSVKVCACQGGCFDPNRGCVTALPSGD